MLLSPHISAKKTLTCSVVNPTWVLDGSTIPSSDSTRWGGTVSQSYFPSFNFVPLQVNYVGFAFVSLRNESGSNQTINYKIYKNNSYITGGTKSVSNNNYGTFLGTFFDISVNDVCEISVWATTPTGISIVGSTLYCMPSRVKPSSKVFYDVSLTVSVLTCPLDILTSALYIAIPSNSTFYIQPAVGTHTFNFFNFNSSYGLFRLNTGDSASLNGVVINTSLTGQYFPCNTYISSISYRELNL